MESKKINTFHSSEEMSKIVARYYLSGILNKLPNIKNFATLPCLNFELENLILNKFPKSQMHIAERCQKTYLKQRKLIKTKCKTHYFGDIIDMLSSNRSKFDFIWLDYCGYFNEDKWNSFLKLLDLEKFSNNCIFAITLCSNREHDVLYFYREFFRTYSKSRFTKRSLVYLKKTLILKAMEKNFIKKGYNIELSTMYSYKTTSTMNMYIIHAKK